MKVSLPSSARVDLRYPDGTPSMVSLVDDEVVGGIPCLGGHVLHFHENGELAQAWVAATIGLGAYELHRGDIVAFGEDASLESIQLASPRSIGGHTDVVMIALAGDGAVRATFLAGGAELDGEGRLVRRGLAEVENIDGVECDPTGPASFHPNGRLSHAKLAQELTTPWGVVPRHSFVSFDDSGRIEAIHLSEPCTLDGTDFPDRRSGTLVRVTPQGPRAEQGWTFFVVDQDGERHVP